MKDKMWTKRLMWVIWPAFLVAGILEMLVFAMVDPQDLHWAGQPLDLSRQGIYTVIALNAFRGPSDTKSQRTACAA